MEASEYFFINIIGQIDYAYYPIGFDGQKLFCRYDVVAGPDWELVSGFSSGVTQNASVGETNDKVVFNMPVEMMFKSTNPFGCEFFSKNLIRIINELFFNNITVFFFRATNHIQFIRNKLVASRIFTWLCSHPCATCWKTDNNKSANFNSTMYKPLVILV